MQKSDLRQESYCNSDYVCNLVGCFLDARDGMDAAESVPPPLFSSRVHAQVPKTQHTAGPLGLARMDEKEDRRQTAWNTKASIDIPIS